MNFMLIGRDKVLAEYVPEYRLLFGLSSKKGSNLLCAFNLATADRRQSAPVARNV